MKAWNLSLPFRSSRTEQRLQQLQRNLGEAEEDKKGIDGRLASAQTALMLQEETIRRNERERKAMADKISAMERQVVAAESDKRQMNVSLVQKMLWHYNLMSLEPPEMVFGLLSERDYNFVQLQQNCY